MRKLISLKLKLKKRKNMHCVVDGRKIEKDCVRLREIERVRLREIEKGPEKGLERNRERLREDLREIEKD